MGAFRGQVGLLLFRKCTVDLYFPRQAPASLNSSFDDLLSYLTSNLENSDRPDVFRARAILVWLSMQDVDSRAVEEGQGDRETPGGYLTLLAQRKSTYSTFFLVLCRYGTVYDLKLNFKTHSFCFDRVLDSGWERTGHNYNSFQLKN